MSIWCSGDEVGYGDDAQPRGGEVRSYADGWSNHYPTTDGEAEQPATVSLASIAPWCVPGWDWEQGGDGLDYPTCGPWVRLDVHSEGALSWWTKDGEKPTPQPIHAGVVMDEAAARQLATDLLAWADRPKVHPR